MKAVRYFSLLAGIGLLAGCVGADVQRLNSISISSGDPFNDQLAVEYRDLANFEASEMGDWRDADLFARKGIAAAEGQPVLPEELGSWMLPADKVDELAAARGRLIVALDGNARASFPIDAAIAQAKFDCWIEQQEENHQPDHIAACRDEFYAALAQIEAIPAPEGPAVYFVFFDFDSSVITSAGQQIVDTVVADWAFEGEPTIDVVGYTDTSGPAAYNQALSERRAASVRAALEAMGVPGGEIFTSGDGENNLLVQTPDGVREPSNWRAEIRFQ